VTSVTSTQFESLGCCSRHSTSARSGLPTALIPTAAVCVGVDPIYAAIQAHKDAYAAHTPHWMPAAMTPQAPPCALWTTALVTISSPPTPTTIAGAVALCRYVAEFGERPGEEGIWGEEGAIFCIRTWRSPSKR
jgi:hypothetical protein